MTDFQDLRYSLKGLFILYYRKHKLEKLVDLLDKIIDGRLVLKHTTFNSFPYDRDPVELRNKVLRLLGRYEKYIEVRNETRAHNKKTRQDNLEERKRLSSGEYKDGVSGNDS
jgi:hypothetical protein